MKDLESIVGAISLLEDEEFTIDVVTRLQDNGDGGYTLYCYNDYDELIADHPKFEEFDKTRPKGKEFFQREATLDEREEILNEDDPYENGYIGEDSIRICVKDGSIKLAKCASFHAGQ